jgi:hypothetical protein
MLVVPGESVGELRFRSTKETVRAQLGPSRSCHDYGDGRESWSFADDLSVLFQEGVGLVAVSSECGTLVLWDRDLFALSAHELREWLAEHHVATTLERDGWGDEVIHARAIGLFAYYIHDDPVPSVELYLGAWTR